MLYIWTVWCEWYLKAEVSFDGLNRIYCCIEDGELVYETSSLLAQSIHLIVCETTTGLTVFVKCRKQFVFNLHVEGELKI